MNVDRWQVKMMRVLNRKDAGILVRRFFGGMES